MPFVFGWLLNGGYLLLLMVIAPVLAFRRITQGKYRRGWSEKLTGRLVRQHPEKACIWFHAVSVGEVLQLQKVLDETASRFPDAELFITVTTETGYDVAKAKYPQHTVSFFPLDFSWAVNRALVAIRPNVIVLVELELWPNLILTAHRLRIPLVLINGRIGAKSFRGYSRLKPLMQRLLSCFDVLAVQNDTYADRLKSLGAPADRVVITGNIKFDRAETDRNNPKTIELRAGFEINATDHVFVAGSTQDPEEAYAIDAWLSLRSEFSQLRLIVVPRHKERFDEVAEVIRQRGCEVIRRSEILAGSRAAISSGSGSAKPVVALLDTIGELAACWGIAEIAFVGGSLTKRGGQNMIEPAGFGAAVLFGPNTWNFKDITESLLSQEAARVVTNSDELREAVRRLLEHPDEERELGQKARAFVASQCGATQRTVNLIAGVVQDQTPPDANGIRSKQPKSYWTVFKWLMFAIVVAFVGRRAMQLWENSPSKTIQIKWLWLVSSGLFYFAGWLPSVWFWKALLNRLSQPLDWWNALRAYYVGHLGKYIPGKALVLVIRGSLVKDAGVNPLLGGVTAVYETLVFMAAGAALCLAISPIAFDELHWNWLPDQLRWLRNYPLLVASVAMLGSFATTPLSASLFSRIGRKALPSIDNPIENKPSISAKLISAGLAITSLGWLCHAMSLGCVIHAIEDGPFDISQFPIWLGACTLSTVGGFVVLIAPGGLGVREGLLIEALKDQPQVGPSTAVIAAGLLRAVWFVTELIVAAVFFMVNPRRR